MRRRGFTWIELLVVLVMIVILAAILMPIFARKREREQGDKWRRTCLANTRMLGLAVAQYVEDYDQRFPLVSVGTQPYGWAEAIQEYVQQAQIFQCPAEGTQPPGPVPGNAPNYTDYFYNSQLSGFRRPASTTMANTVLVGDATPGDARHHSDGGSSKRTGVANLVNIAGKPVGAATRHLGGANYAFADGHVMWMQGSNANTCPTLQNAASGLNWTQPGFAVK